MIGRSNVIGGGAKVIYDFVTASSFAGLPSIAAENTIGIITTVAIPKDGVIVSNDRPAGRPVGEVRIKPGNDGLNKMTILETPLVEVAPISVYQTNGTTWTLMEAYIRKSAAWKRIRTYFYKEGVIGLAGSLVGYNAGQGAYSLSSTYFTLSLGTGGTSGFARVGPNIAFDCSNIDTLKISYTGSRSDTVGTMKARLLVNTVAITGSNASYSDGLAYASLSLATSGSIASVDVSGVNQSVFWQACLGKSSYYESASIRVNEIWGE